MDHYNNETILEQAREIESLREQLAAALAACESKDTILRGITLYRAFNGDDWPAREATQALTIKPDTTALKAHDDALIEKIAQRMADSGIGGKYIAEAIRD